MLHGQARRLGQLLLRRLAAKLDLEPARGAAELLLALDHVHGDADRARIVGHGALHRLADPQVAYVENLKPRRQSNFSTARLRPSVPSWIRSRNGTPRPR